VEVAASAQLAEQQTVPHATPLGQHLPSVVYPFRHSSAHLLPSHFAFPGQHCSPHHFPSQQLPLRMFFGSQHVGFPTAPASVLFAQIFPGGQHVPSKYGHLPIPLLASAFVPQTRSFGQHRFIQPPLIFQSRARDESWTHTESCAQQKLL